MLETSGANTENPPVQFRKATLVGVGLLGGSLGMALRTRRLAGSVVGLVRRAASIRGFYGQVTTLVPGLTPCLKCLFPEFPKDDSPSVLGPVCGVIGCLRHHVAVVAKGLIGLLGGGIIYAGFPSDCPGSLLPSIQGLPHVRTASSQDARLKIETGNSNMALHIYEYK